MRSRRKSSPSVVVRLAFDSKGVAHPIYVDERLIVDFEIKSKKATIRNFKRAKGREWMGVLFGGFLECNEKGSVVATLGHAIIRNLSAETTQQDLPRVHFSDESQVLSPMVEAERKPNNNSFVVRAGDEAEQSSNKNRTGGTPRETTGTHSQHPHRADPIRGHQARPNVSSVNHPPACPWCSVLTISDTSSITGAIVPGILLMTSYPKALRQRHLSQKDLGFLNVQTGRTRPGMRTSPIVLIFQALARVRTLLHWFRHLRTLRFMPLHLVFRHNCPLETFTDNRGRYIRV